MTQNDRQAKARAMRYKKPLVRGLNLAAIQERLFEIGSEVDDVRWYTETDAETLTQALVGDEDAAEEFKLMFAELSSDCAQMQSDLDELDNFDALPECFDLFFVAVGAGDSWGGYMGFDSYMGDYFGIDRWEGEQGRKVATAKLERMTKAQLIDAARLCFSVYQSYVGLIYRYDCLKASLDILRGANNAMLKMIREIEDMYAKAEEDSCGFKYLWCESVRSLDRLLDALPDRAWIE